MLAAAMMALAIVQPAAAKTFRFAYQSGILFMDPHSVNEPFTVGFLANIMEPLVRYNEDYKLEPALAVSWELLEPTVWRFKLRQKVRFHNGNPFNADDVVFSLKRGLSEGSDYKAALSAIADVKRVDDSTVDIVLKNPYPILIYTLPSFLIMDKQWAEAQGAAAPIDIKLGKSKFAGLSAMGTGPFVLKSHEADVKTVLVPNPDWWDEPQHNLTEVVFTPIRAAATRVAALLSGSIDMMFPAPIQDVPRIDATAGLSVLQGPSHRTIYLSMDQARAELNDSNIKGRNPFQDVRVRRAIYHAIDIEAIRDKIMRGAATPAGLLHAPSLNGFDPALNERLPFDPDKASGLLEEAGYPEGFSVGMDCPNDRYINDEAICRAIAAMLARVGIQVNLQAMTKSRFFEKVQKRDSSFFLMGWAAATTKDAHNLLSYVVHTPDELQGTWNGGGYSNKRIDELIDRIAVENDPDKRQAMISEAFRIHKEGVGHVPLHQQNVMWAVRDGVELVQAPDNILRLQYVNVLD
jgi:peptide/nickel transport system substrate-binding protein